MSFGGPWARTLVRDLAFSVERSRRWLGEVKASGQTLKELSNVLDELDSANRTIETLTNRELR